MILRDTPILGNLHLETTYPPVLKRGLLEDPPLKDDFPLIPEFMRDFPACHVWVPEGKWELIYTVIYLIYFDLE